MQQEERKTEAKRIGTLIRQLREERQWTQTELAARMQVTRAAISDFEHGHSLPKKKNREKLAQLFGVAPSMFQTKFLSFREKLHADLRSNPLAKRLTELRVARGLRQQDIHPHMGLYETGKRIPRMKLLREFAQALQADEQEFLSLRDQSYREQEARQQWPYVIANGIHAGKRARIIDPPRKAYKPHPEDQPDPVWCQFEHLPLQWFPRGRLYPLETQK